MEVIPCRDCEFYNPDVTVAKSDDGYESTLNICSRNKWFVPENGHCHRAKRKE